QSTSDPPWAGDSTSKSTRVRETMAWRWPLISSLFFFPALTKLPDNMALRQIMIQNGIAHSHVNSLFFSVSQILSRSRKLPALGGSQD
ncbi:MAG: hypothetical protein U5L00_12645, partial [Desulfovermiculus sp.]|nr:hypothetical protein [Desulfovermiculus sp.]